MTALPDKPQITNSEVTEALKVAHQLGWCYGYDQEGNVMAPLSEMEMLQVLQAAFDHRHQRFNGELRREAQALNRSAELSRIRLQKYEKERDLVEWAQRVQSRLTGLLEAIKNSRALRISEEFHSLELLLQREDTGPPVNPDEIYTEGDARYDLDR